MQIQGFVRHAPIIVRLVKLITINVLPVYLLSIFIINNALNHAQMEPTNHNLNAFLVKKIAVLALIHQKSVILAKKIFIL